MKPGTANFIMKQILLSLITKITLTLFERALNYMLATDFHIDSYNQL